MSETLINYNMFNKNIVNITQLLQLPEMDISLSDINWFKVKMTSYRWIACRHNKISLRNSTPYYPLLFNASYCDNNLINNSINDNMNELSIAAKCAQQSHIEISITIVNPNTNQIHNCQTSGDTNCAQMNPLNELIAISNDKFLAVYCVISNKCINTLPFTSKCIYWNWINDDLIVIITEQEVFHWNINSSYEPSFIFKLDQRFLNQQITNYKCDKLASNWFAVSTIYIDDENEIIGLVQIYSQCYNQTQCIEAHTCNFTTYKFSGNTTPTNVLIAAKRTPFKCFKLYVIELGPIQQGNLALISRTEIIPLLDPFDNKYDFPVLIECSEQLGLIYLLSKYGVIYISDIESGAFIYSTQICYDIVFLSAFDAETQSVITVLRDGRVLSIELYLSYFVAHLSKISKKDIAQRIQLFIENSSDCDQVTRL